MPPDRPDASAVDTGIGLSATQAFGFGGNGYGTMKEKENAAFSESGSVDERDEDVPIREKFTEKNSQSDDELTSLSWLHQQNLLKGLDISDSSKDVKNENVLNNNVCDDVTDFSENTNSISSLDDGYCPETNGKSLNTYHGGQNQQQQQQQQQHQQYHNHNHHHNHHHHHHHHSKNSTQKSSHVFQDSMKSHYDSSQSNQTKISLSNNNLPVSNRNKHPTHIPYDPHLHRNSKPPYSFSCLIFMAIEDSPVKALPVKEVYAWILDHFPYFRNAPTGWKNSVRHNLSLNKCFRKVEKAPNLGKGSLWMVDAQYRPNLIQALSRAPFPPPTAQNLSPLERTPRKSANARLPDPVLFPYLSKRLASSNIGDTTVETDVDSDVDAAAAAMLSFKHGPIILNHNKDRKRKLADSEKLVPIITRSSSEDHTYSCVTSVKVESRYSKEETAATTAESGTDFDEQRKIAEGADALLNLAGVNTTLNHSRTQHHVQSINVAASKPTNSSKTKKRSATNDYSNTSDKRRKRWRDWGEGNRYLKQIRG